MKEGYYSPIIIVGLPSLILKFTSTRRILGQGKWGITGLPQWSAIKYYSYWRYWTSVIGRELVNSTRYKRSTKFRNKLSNFPELFLTCRESATDFLGPNNIDEKALCRNLAVYFFSPCLVQFQKNCDGTFSTVRVTLKSFVTAIWDFHKSLEWAFPRPSRECMENCHGTSS